MARVGAVAADAAAATVEGDRPPGHRIGQRFDAPPMAVGPGTVDGMPMVRPVAVVALALAAVVSCSANDGDTLTGQTNGDAGDTAGDDASSTPPVASEAVSGEPAGESAPADATSTAHSDDPGDQRLDLPAPADGPDLLGPPLVEMENLLDVVIRPTDQQLFAVDRLGRVLRVDGGDVEIVLDIEDELTPYLEWGLLGMTFSADGSVAYVNETDGYETRVHEFPVAPDGSFDEAERRIVYRFDQPNEGHNGGDMHIGPDGLLYVFTGDGGGDRWDPEFGGSENSDVNRHALSLASPLGKILRIDPTPSSGSPFTVPADNPFVDVEGALGEIWAIGLRNPWRNAFDPATGDLWVADVGNAEWEEISVAAPADTPDDAAVAARGVSFGWSAWEGVARANDDQAIDGHLDPMYVYSHETDCSIVGGPRYRSDAIPELTDRYLFGDFCSGSVWAMEVTDELTPASVSRVATVPFLVDITAGPDGTVYVTSIVDGVFVLASGDDG